MNDTIKVDYSKRDKCYIAHIPHIYVDAFGDTKEDALNELKVAFGLWAEVMIDLIEEKKVR